MPEVKLLFFITPPDKLYPTYQWYEITGALQMSLPGDKLIVVIETDRGENLLRELKILLEDHTLFPQEQEAESPIRFLLIWKGSDKELHAKLGIDQSYIFS